MIGSERWKKSPGDVLETAAGGSTAEGAALAAVAGRAAGGRGTGRGLRAGSSV
ncbi:hypothetical protein ACWDFL_37125 [Streptomyces bungoensis]